MTGLPPQHKTIADTVLEGKRIPKGTQVLYSLYAAHKHPATCPEPQKFKPERFLDENGHFMKDTGFMISFSLGKRRCPGELLARAEVTHSHHKESWSDFQ